MQELQNLKIFSGIDKNLIDKLVNNLARESFLAGQIIVNEGDESNGKGYIILSGGVDVIIGGQKVTSLFAGEVFGEIALLNEDARTATLIANLDLEVLVITQEAILEIMNQDNYLNKEIMRRVQENTLK